MLVLLADDQPLFRHALKTTISAAINQHKSARDSIQAGAANAIQPCSFIECESAEQLNQSLSDSAQSPQRTLWLVSDLQLQGQSLFSQLEEIKQQHPNCKVVVVSAQTHATEVGRAFKLGIDGFIAKQQDSLAIQHAFEEILQGRRAISLPPAETRQNNPRDTFDARRSLENESGQPTQAGQSHGRSSIAATCIRLGLTARETEVLMLLSDGYSNKQIAQQLGITEHTVKVHLTKIFRALRVTSRAQALAYLMRSGNSIDH